MGFVDLSKIPTITPIPGSTLRTPFGQNLMLSYLEMEDGAEVPLHHHPHEQRGILLEGKVQHTIGDETHVVERGYYLDQPFTCVDCGKDEVWTATQQKWWYEVAKGDVFTTARRCRICRRRDRERRTE
ncbi:zinc-ribbon domain containing protein [Planctellipticum variicoloris]|uniref:zinc-ribbon domain containing protein n=1 Tax=Planctellipticum variicoloris TaxID=3064265 RepID=UPI003013C907|nr:zinc-ribbon domain containing protein [Planctomycetaceae bacterium SH412]